MDKQRSSNVELLRIISMIMIVSFHCVYHGNFSFDTTMSMNKFIVKTVWMLGELGVNEFILISGYYMINSSFKFKKLVSLVLQVLFYHLLTSFVAIKLGVHQITGTHSYFQMLFPISSNIYWFMTAYIVIYIFSPYLNFFAKNLSKTSFKKFLLIAISLYSVFPTIFGTVYNSTESLLYYNRLIWLVFVFLIGTYIRIHGINAISTTKSSFYVFTLSFGFLMFSILFIDKFDKFFAAIGTTEVAYLWQPNSLPMLFTSLGLFGFFVNFHISYSKIINLIASTTLGIYLIHDGNLRYWIWQTVFSCADYQHSPTLILHIAFSVTTIFILGFIIDYLRQLLEKHTVKRLLDSQFVTKTGHKLAFLLQTVLDE